MRLVDEIIAAAREDLDAAVRRYGREQVGQAIMLAAAERVTEGDR